MVTIDKQIMAKVLDDKSFKDEVCELLNRLIDSEFEKDDCDIDFDFIEDCSKTIIFVQDREAVFNRELVTALGKKEFLNRIHKFSLKGLSTSAKIILIAAVLFVSTITANAAVQDLTGKSIFENVAAVSDEETTNPLDETTEEAETDPVEEAEETTVSVSLTDDSTLYSKAKKNTRQKGTCIRKSSESDQDLRLGKEIQYKKLGTAPKRTLVFQTKDDFDEKDYLATEYGVPYCELTSDHVHDFTKWKVTKQSTCSQRGEKERTCKVCSAKQICPVPANGNHKGVLDNVLKKASYDDYGSAGYQCTQCDAWIEAKIAKPEYLILDEDVFYYNGKNQRPRLIAVIDSDGYEIPSKYYKIRSDYENSKRCGYSYYVCVDFDCEFYEYGLSAKYFIYPASVHLSGIYAGKGELIPYWKKSEDITGYQLQYSASSDFTSAKKINVNGVNTQTHRISNLKSGKKYYVRMRAYYYDEIYMKNIYSPWSDVRQVTVK